MQKIEDIKNSNYIRIHINNYWKKYRRDVKKGRKYKWKFKRVKVSDNLFKIIASRDDTNFDFAWEISKSYLSKEGKKLIVKRKEILPALKKILSEENITDKYQIISDYDKLRKRKKKENLENPPHWYFPISYAELKGRKIENTRKAIKKLGLTLEQLDENVKKMLSSKEKKKKRRKRKKSSISLDLEVD